MNDFVDLAVVPDPTFADRLERELLADMGWAPAPRRGAEIAARRRRTVAVASAALLVAALIVLAVFLSRGDDGPEPPVTTVSPPSTTTTSTTSAPPTSAPTTTGEPPTSVAVAEGMPQRTPLDPGTLYNAGRGAVGLPLRFTPTEEGIFGYGGGGFLGLSRDDDGLDMLVSVLDLAQARAFTDPRDDLNALGGTVALAEATEPVPSDYFAYFATLPGVSTGPIETTEFAGYPARKMTYEFGAFDGGHVCFNLDGNCVLTTWMRIGVVTNYLAGDRGTLYELQIDGRPVLVEVRDTPGAAELAETIVIG